MFEKNPFPLKACLLLFTLLFSVYGSAQQVTKLILVNSDSNTEIKELTEYDTIDLVVTGKNLNIVAEVEGEVTNVVFGLNDNANYSTEGVAPYAMAGDNNGNYNAWNPETGDYVITATPNSGTGLSCNLHVYNSSDPGQAGAVYELPADPGTGNVSISGELKKWHKITLSIDGPAFKENDSKPSPFLDYRLNATFRNGEKSFVVPGYFAADGNAAETSSDSGNIWKVHFSPDEIGEWTYELSFRLEEHIAINTDANAGIQVFPIDGATGSFTVSETDKTGNDNRAKGRLTYVKDHYLIYAGTGEVFVKGGADSPENFLAYEDFDNTPNSGDLRKSWSPHADDYRTGDPSWQSGKGTEIIGAVNYLVSKGLNAFSFLTMNINGDDKNVFPYNSESTLYEFDCSKLDQWEIVFNHADTVGMFLHFKTQETENEMLLDDGKLGPQRKLYYRELIARFGHHLALNWNLGEENGHYGTTNQNTQQRKDMAKFFIQNDPYKNHVVIHTAPDKIAEIYNPLLGSASELTGVSLQTGWNNSYAETLKWRTASSTAKKRWVVAHDEQNSHKTGVPPDDYTGSPNKDDIRKQTLWGNLMAGGTGVEYYFGYELPESDLSCQDWRLREQSWEYVNHALSFFRTLPLQEMTPDKKLVSSGWCLASEGNTYVIYLQNGGTSTVKLNTNATYTVSWFNPRTGESGLQGDVTSVSGPGEQSIGNPPSEGDDDWAVLIQIDATQNEPPVAAFDADTLIGLMPLKVSFNATESFDSDGSIVKYKWDFNDTFVANTVSTEHTFRNEGVHEVILQVTDDKGAQATKSAFIEVRKSDALLCGDYVEMFSKDFPYHGTDFYLDSYTDWDLLAIEPTPPDTASASVTQEFTGETCTYNITLHTIGENDGRSSFTVSINGTELGTFKVPLSTESWEAGPDYNHTWNEISIAHGDEITVAGKTGSDDTEWSRARWLKLEFTPSGTDTCEHLYSEEGGLIILEAESLEYSSGWQLKNSATGFTGAGYLEWTGSDYFNQPGNGLIEQQIKINNPGVYEFKWHCKVGHGTNTTEANDTWLRFPDATDFFATKSTGDTVRPHGVCTDDCPEGAGKDGWFKVFSSGTTNWTWTNLTSDNQGYKIKVKFDTAGVYTLQLSGRSAHHLLNRIVLYHLGMNVSGSTDLKKPESRCGMSEQKYFASEKNYPLKEMKETVVIDGVEEPEAWGGIVEDKGAFEVNGNSLPPGIDYSYTFKLAYDTTWLYLFATVQDQLAETSGDNSSNYEDYDNIELFFNPDHLHFENGAYGDDALQLRLNFGVENNSASGNGTWKGDANYSGIEYVSSVTSEGYTFEGKIPWEGILDESFEFDYGNSFGFEFMGNDNDDGLAIKYSLAWANDLKINNAANDTRLFGKAVLTKNTWVYTNSLKEKDCPTEKIKAYLTTHDNLRVSGLNELTTNSLKIFSATGQLLIAEITNQSTTNINISNLLPGVYFLHTNSGTVKFVK